MRKDICEYIQILFSYVILIGLRRCKSEIEDEELLKSIREVLHNE